MNPLQKAVLVLEAAESSSKHPTSDGTTVIADNKRPHRSSKRWQQQEDEERNLPKISSKPTESRKIIDLTGSPSPPPTKTDPVPVATPKEANIVPLPSRLTRKITHLDKAEHSLLLAKQSRLVALSSQLYARHPSPSVANAVSSTLIFAQEAAGTAVCISPSGQLLTCSHCVSEDENFSSTISSDSSTTQWLLFASGRIVQTRCTAFDAKRDLALLQIIAAQPGPLVPISSSLSLSQSHRTSLTTSPNLNSFPHIRFSRAPPKPLQPLLCIGHPGSEDLESPSGGPTSYPVLSVSTGRFRGLASAKKQSIQDNSEIGALKHDCWTYWGHSGAPLADVGNGELIGLHSSWDDRTGMRRGIAWECMMEFLQGKDKMRNE